MEKGKWFSVELLYKDSDPSEILVISLSLAPECGLIKIQEVLKKKKIKIKIEKINQSINLVTVAISRSNNI